MASSNIIRDKWLQDTAEAVQIPALSPHVVSVLVPIVEAQVKKIAQQAHKFQRKSKSSNLTGMYMYTVSSSSSSSSSSSYYYFSSSSSSSSSPSSLF